MACVYVSQNTFAATRPISRMGFSVPSANIACSSEGAFNITIGVSPLSTSLATKLTVGPSLIVGYELPRIETNVERLIRELEELVCGYSVNSAITQKAFWELYDDLGVCAPKFWLIDGQHRLPAFGAKNTQLFMSETDRSEILSTLDYLFRNCTDKTVLLSDVRALLAAEIRRAIIRTTYWLPKRRVNAPSTQQWVHTFMLWTGISPPVAETTRSVPFQANEPQGEIRDNSRSCLIRHSRQSVDRRTTTFNSRSRVSRGPPSARRWYAGRY